MTGEVLPDGEKGELVFTSLTKEALPIIRYRTRDLTRLLPPTARAMRRMEKITGRSDDMMIIRGVNVFPTQIEELILKDAVLAPHYQLEITRPGNLDELTVLVERVPAAGSADGNAAGTRLAHHIKNLIGVTAEVRVCAPGSIERSLGKAQAHRRQAAESLRTYETPKCEKNAAGKPLTQHRSAKTPPRGRRFGFTSPVRRAPNCPWRFGVTLLYGPGAPKPARRTRVPSAR